jgi:VanZ family protein
VKYLQSSIDSPQHPALPKAWLPVFFGVAVVACESTALMSAANTSHWLLDLCHSLWGQTDSASFELTHFLLRKLGHFTGYGLLSLLFRRAWSTTLRHTWKGPRSRLPFSAAALAVLCTFVIACLDEWHQRYLLGRTSSPYDVLIDTSGAILLNVALTYYMARRRRALLQRL